MADKKDSALALLGAIKNFTGAFFHGYLFKLVDKYGAKLVDTFPYPFPGELKGIANATGIPIGEIVLYNLFYEVFSVCTSIIVEDQSGKLYHARNLDFGLFMGWDVKNKTWLVTEYLRDLVVELDFQKDGNTVFKSVNFAGYVGILTGIKPTLFTLTIDERFGLKGGYIGILEWIFGRRSGSWMGFLTRNVLENSTSYGAALKMLANTRLLAPVYFIIAGNRSGEGCIITRGLKSLDLLELRNGKSGWYLVETNYDHWKEPPFYDDRRNPAMKCLDKNGQQNISLGALYNVLSTQPVLNKLTTYTALMQVDTGHLETYIQECGNPCWPW